MPGYVVGMGVCLVMWYAWNPTAITTTKPLSRGYLAAGTHDTLHKL